MKFNSKKFQYINFTVSPQCNTSNVYVSADSNLIDPSHTVNDLGVLMSNDCMFDDHICQAGVVLPAGPVARGHPNGRRASQSHILAGPVGQP